MIDNLACVYRYFLFGFNYDFDKDMREFRAMQNRTDNRTLSSIAHILMTINRMKYRQIGASTRGIAIHGQSFEVVRFMAKYS